MPQRRHPQRCRASRQQQSRSLSESSARCIAAFTRQLAARTVRLYFFRLTLRRAPHEESFLSDGHEAIQRKRECSENENAGKYGIDIEHRFRLKNEIAHTCGRAEVLADYCTHESHSDGRVETRK